jgi:hypothetical protein
VKLRRLEQWVTGFQRFGKTNMDFAALQQKLFDLDPSDRAEDLRRLTESVGSSPQPDADDEAAALAAVGVATHDAAAEASEVAQGTMPVEGDYSLSDFAALAGVKLNEGLGDDLTKKAKHGFDNYNNLNAFKVGSSTKPKTLKNPVDKTPVARPGDWQGFLKQHTAQLQKIAADTKKKSAFDQFMAKMAEDVQEAPKPKMPKTRNPVASHAQSSGSGVHADQNKKKQPMRKDKHKKQLDFATESIKEMLYRKLNAKK